MAQPKVVSHLMSHGGGETYEVVVVVLQQTGTAGSILTPVQDE